MSEKRYYMEDGVLKDGATGEAVSLYGIDDLLNKFYEENEKLRFLIDINSLSERRKLERQVDEQQDIINILLECLYVAEDTVINEYSSHIAEDMEKLNKIFEDKDIEEIRKFVLGDDSGRI